MRFCLRIFLLWAFAIVCKGRRSCGPSSSFYFSPHPPLTSYSPSTYLVSGSVPPSNISHTCIIVIHSSVSQMSAQVFQTSYTKPKCWPTWYSRELYTSSTWHICRVIHSLIIQHNSKAIISPPYRNSWIINPHTPHKTLFQENISSPLPVSTQKLQLDGTQKISLSHSVQKCSVYCPFCCL